MSNIPETPDNSRRTFLALTAAAPAALALTSAASAPPPPAAWRVTASP
ncbi:hypothetical protein FF80_03735 [Devosia sp. LC5]|nr:hypothetical protein FF80_03735 [Devosia sp. LC5]